MKRGLGRVHRQVRGFDRVAERYERGRPDYPASAVRFLTRRIRLGPGRTVLELASGTGKLTRALLPTGAAIVAVEPTDGMRRVFRRTVPQVLVLDGTAERIPLPDSLAEAVVVGQAFHWFRTGPALREIHRVLRPGGRLALVWNLRSRSTPVGRALHRLLEGRVRGLPRSRDSRWKAAFRRRSHGFGPLEERTFRHTQQVDEGTLVDRVLSVSAIATLSPRGRARVAAEVRRLARDTQRGRTRRAIRIPYRTEVYIARRTRPRG